MTHIAVQSLATLFIGLLGNAFTFSTAAQPAIEANISRISQNRQPVSVKIHGVQRPTAADVVALYLSAQADLASSVPLKYKWLASTNEYLATGSATER